MADSYILDHDASASDSDELDSLPSISSSVLDSEADSDAQAEWERSLEQMQLLLTMILVPFAGKYFGRKFAYWSECRTSRDTRDQYADCNPHRLGPIHGMDAQRRDHVDQQDKVQGRRCRRGGGDAVEEAREHFIIRHDRRLLKPRL
jgi:MIM2-like protein